MKRKNSFESNGLVLRGSSSIKGGIIISYGTLFTQRSVSNRAAHIYKQIRYIVRDEKH